MDPRIKQRFNDQILAEAMRRFDIAPDQIQLLDGFESFMYAFTRGGEPYILRVGHSSRRPTTLIEGEVEWINYLYNGGATVARAYQSAQGKLVEAVPDGAGEYFLATAFLRAPGDHLPGKDWNNAFFERYGALLGRMHHLSRDFLAVYPRPHWDEPIMLYAEGMLPPSETAALERYRILMAHLRSLPRDDRSAYGMIHQDAHGGNFFVDAQGTITLFDFDDCCYSWYINDIAIVLFYAVLFKPDPEAWTRNFMTHFLAGYRRENDLDPAWLVEIPNFLKLREIDLYAVIHRSFDVNNLTGRFEVGFMHNRKERIEAGVPFVDFDFSTLTM